MAKTISLTSKHLKVGDKIIRIAPNHGDYSFTTTISEVISRTSTHIKLKGQFGDHILLIYYWDDGNWIKTKL